MCRYLPSSAVNRPVGLGVYTKAILKPGGYLVACITAGGKNGLGCCCCRVSAASRARRARRAAAIRRRSRARSAALFLMALRPHSFSVVDVVSSMKTVGPPSVAIKVVTILPWNDGISAAGSGEIAGEVAADRFRGCGDGGDLHFDVGHGRLGSRHSGGKSCWCPDARLLRRFTGFAASSCTGTCRRQRCQFLRLGRTGRRSLTGGAGTWTVVSGHSPPVPLQAAGQFAVAPASTADRHRGRQTSARAVARREGRLANSSCAARSRAAAPGRKPGPTSKARSRSTGSESREAWTRVPSPP